MKIFEISQDAFKTYTENLNLAKNHSKEDLDLTDFVNKRKDCRVENNIGFVHIYGTLLRDTTPIDKLMGNTDYADICEDIETVIEQGAKAIVLVCDSGGGSVSGSTEACEAIQGASVPIVGYVAGNACSAAYKAICGATHLIASSSAILGNIGSILVWIDESQANSGMGVSVSAFTNKEATLKSIGHVDGLTDEQSEFLQSQIDYHGTNFQNHVLQNRPDINQVCFKAGWYSGTQAIDLGLADEIGSIDLAIQRANELIGVFEEVTDSDI